MPKWQPFEIESKTFDLGHLDDRMLFVGVAGRDIGIVVEFTDHCFTVDAIGTDPRPKFPGCTRSDGRFCEIRYAASLQLWEHIERAVKGRVWHGEHDRSLLVAVEIEENGQRRFYVVPFTLDRLKGIKGVSLKMRVRSGFIKDKAKHIATFGEVRFTNLVSLAEQGKAATNICGETKNALVKKRPFRACSTPRCLGANLLALAGCPSIRTVLD